MKKLLLAILGLSMIQCAIAADNYSEVNYKVEILKLTPSHGDLGGNSVLGRYSANTLVNEYNEIQERGVVNYIAEIACDDNGCRQIKGAEDTGVLIKYNLFKNKGNPKLSISYDINDKMVKIENQICPDENKEHCVDVLNVKTNRIHQVQKVEINKPMHTILNNIDYEITVYNVN